MKAVWIGGGAAALIVGFLAIGANAQRNDAAARQKCATAIMSNMGTSTTGYADRQAYDKHVAADCEGFNIPKR